MKKTDNLYNQIYDDLLNGIREGFYQEGDRLPSEMKLAKQYGVSRITSQKAMDMLADRGYVIRCQGTGTFVAPPAKQEEKSAEVENLRLQTKTQPASARKPVVGIVMDSFYASFNMDVLNGLEYECRRRGMVPLIHLTYGSVEKEQQAIRDLVQAGASGFVLVCVQGETYNVELLRLYVQQFPVILIDRRMPGLALPMVTTDNRKAVRELTEMLIHAGHTKIGYISYSQMDSATVTACCSAFRDVLQEHGIRMDSAWILPKQGNAPQGNGEGDSMQAYREAMLRFIDEHPELTAFFAVEYASAKLLYSVLSEKHLIGQKQIVYFDGFIEPLAPAVQIPHILQNQYQIGVQAIRSLERRMKGETVQDCEFVPYKLYGLPA